jgi:penicillin-binding protein 1B
MAIRFMLRLILTGSCLACLSMILLILSFILTTVVPMVERLQTKGAPQGYSNRHFLPIEEYPPQLKTALLLLEDNHFYSHWGINTDSIYTAITLNYQDQNLLRGGSSISQQLARTFMLNTEKNLIRKSLELAGAIAFELSIGKERIFELYLNYIPLAPGVRGFAHAARHYFRLPISELNDQQMARIIAIMPSPMLYTPNNYQYNTHLAERYQHTILALQRLRALNSVP